MFYISDEYLDRLLKEDIPLSDVTTEGLRISDVPGIITCFPKQKGIVSGIQIAARLFKKVGLTIKEQGQDGAIYDGGQTVLCATGSAAQIHSVYKVAQNVMEYSSSISGRTYEMRLEAERGNPKARVAVTRKHFPGTKFLSLSAAVAGGAVIHRTGLSESILIFDQHRTFVKDLKTALAGIKQAEPEKKVAIESDSVEEALHFVALGADILQCERFTIEQMKEFSEKAKAVNPNLIINCAGGVNASNAFEYAKAGADVLVTSWVYFGKPFDIKMKIEAL